MKLISLIRINQLRVLARATFSTWRVISEAWSGCRGCACVCSYGKDFPGRCNMQEHRRLQEKWKSSHTCVNLESDYCLIVYCSNCLILGDYCGREVCLTSIRWKQFWRTNERPSVAHIRGTHALALPARRPWPPGQCIISSWVTTTRLAPGEHARQLITHGKSVVPSKMIRHLKYFGDKH